MDGAQHPSPLDRFLRLFIEVRPGEGSKARLGDVLSALVVFIGTTYFALQASGFAKFNIALVLVWLVLALSIGQQYKHLAATGRQPS